MQSKQIFLLSLLLASAFSHPMHRSISLGDLNALTTLQPDSAEFDDVAGRLQRIALVGQDQQLLDKAFRASTNLYRTNPHLQDYKRFEIGEIRKSILKRYQETFDPSHEEEAFTLLGDLAHDLKTQTHAAPLITSEQKELKRAVEAHLKAQKDFEQKLSVSTQEELEKMRQELQSKGSALLDQMTIRALQTELDVTQQIAKLKQDQAQDRDYFLTLIQTQEELRRFQSMVHEAQKSLEAAAAQRRLAQINSRLERAENRSYWATAVAFAGVGIGAASLIYAMITLKGMPFQPNSEVHTTSPATSPVKNTPVSSQGLETRVQKLESRADAHKERIEKLESDKDTQATTNDEQKTINKTNDVKFKDVSTIFKGLKHRHFDWFKNSKHNFDNIAEKLETKTVPENT